MHRPAALWISDEEQLPLVANDGFVSKLDVWYQSGKIVGRLEALF